MHKNKKNVLYKVCFLKRAYYLSDCGHSNKLVMVKISNSHLQYFLQNMNLSED